MRHKRGQRVAAHAHGTEGIRNAVLSGVHSIEHGSFLDASTAELCFGYSIEFGGRDAFVDEFYLVEAARRRGIGSKVLEAVKAEAANAGVRVLHLEVARSNAGAKQLYSKAGFTARGRFHLMSCKL